jgi:hypothetical protein
VQVAAPAPQTTGKLLAVCPNVAELLAIMALHKPFLSFIGLYPGCDMSKAWQSENFLRFCRPMHGYEEQGDVYGC